MPLAAALDFSIFLKPAFDGSGNYLRFILVGLQWTLWVSVCAWLLAFCVGSIVGVCRTLPGRLAPVLATAYVEVFRNVPLLVQLFIWYFVIPDLVPGFGPWFKERLNPGLQQFVAATLCLGLFTAARVAEQVRGGIGSLPPGQRPAALALGLTLPQAYGLVLLPVAYRIIIPTLTSEFLNVIKNSAVASTIGLVELSRQSQQLTDFTAHAYESFIAVTVCYALINLAVLAAARWTERAARLPGLGSRP